MNSWTSEDWRNIIAVFALVVTPLTTLLGAYVGYFLSQRGEQRRFTDQRVLEQARWEREERIKAYANFVSGARQAQIHWGTYHDSAQSKGNRPSDTDEFESEVLRITAEFDSAYFQCHLLATPPVRQATNAIMVMIQDYKGGKRLVSERENAVFADLTGKFIDAARAELSS